MADKDRAERSYVPNTGYKLPRDKTKKDVYNAVAEVAPSIGEFHPEPVDQAAARRFERFIRQSEFDKPYWSENYGDQEYLWDEPGFGSRRRDAGTAHSFDTPLPSEEISEPVTVVFNAFTEDKYCPGEAKEVTFNTTEPYTGFQVLFAETGTVVTEVRQNSDNQVVLEIDADINQRGWVRIVFYMRTVEGITGDAILNVDREACGHYVVVKMGDHCTVYDAKNDKVADDVIDNAGTGTVTFPAAFSAIDNWINNYALSNALGFIWSETPQNDGSYITYSTKFPCYGQSMCDRGFSATTFDAGYYSLNAFWDENCAGVPCTVKTRIAPLVCPPAVGGPAFCCTSPMIDQFETAPCDYGGNWPLINQDETPTSVMSELDCAGTVMTNDLYEDYMYYMNMYTRPSPPAPPGLNCPETNLPFDYTTNPHGCGRGKDEWAVFNEERHVHADGGGGTFWSKLLTCNFPAPYDTVTDVLRREYTEDKKYHFVIIAEDVLGVAADYTDDEAWMDQTLKLHSPLGEIVSMTMSTHMYMYFVPPCLNAGQPTGFPSSYENSTGDSIDLYNYRNDITGSHWEGAVNVYSEKTVVQIYSARFKRYTLATGNIAPPSGCLAPLAAFPNDGCNQILNGQCGVAVNFAWTNLARYSAYRTENGYYSGLAAQCDYYPEKGAYKQDMCNSTTNATFETAIDSLITYYYTQEGLGANDVPDKDDNFEVGLFTFSKRSE